MWFLLELCFHGLFFKTVHLIFQDSSPYFSRQFTLVKLPRGTYKFRNPAGLPLSYKDAISSNNFSDPSCCSSVQVEKERSAKCLTSGAGTLSLVEVWPT